jgi:hypothetical protein
MSCSINGVYSTIKGFASTHICLLDCSNLCSAPCFAPSPGMHMVLYVMTCAPGINTGPCITGDADCDGNASTTSAAFKVPHLQWLFSFLFAVPCPSPGSMVTAFPCQATPRSLLRHMAHVCSLAEHLTHQSAIDDFTAPEACDGWWLVLLGRRCLYPYCRHLLCTPSPHTSPHPRPSIQLQRTSQPWTKGSLR